MNDTLSIAQIKDILPIFGLVLAVFDIIIFIYGLKVNKRKIMVIKAKYTFLINFILILLLGLIIFFAAKIIFAYDWSLEFYCIMGFIIVLGLVAFIFHPINLNIFNVSKDEIYDNLNVVLSRHGVNYEYKRSKLFIESSKAFVRIRYNKLFRTCLLALSDTKYPKIIEEVFSDFKGQLNNKETNLKPIMGMFFIFMAIVLFILVIVIFILYFEILSLTVQ